MLELLPQFYTATNLNWKPLLMDDKYKDIIIEDLQYQVNRRLIKLYAFVIMPNHVHYIWQCNSLLTYSKVRASHQKVIAQKIKRDLILSKNNFLQEFYVGAKDREYQFFKRNPLSIPLYSPNVIDQKLNYIHNNPLQEKWRLAESPEDYFYSSADFYKTGIDRFNMLSHISEINSSFDDISMVKKSIYWQ